MEELCHHENLIATFEAVSIVVVVGIVACVEIVEVGPRMHDMPFLRVIDIKQFVNVRVSSAFIAVSP